MKITSFQDTETLYIEFRAASVAETRGLDENTLLGSCYKISIYDGFFRSCFWPIA